MATLADLELSMMQVTAGFVFLYVCLKYAIRRLNGFDVLALLVFGVASFRPYTKEKVGFILDTVFFVVVVALVAVAAGANRRGTMFLSGLLLFSDAMVRHREIVGEVEDVKSCTPIQLGAAAQALLFFTVGYVIVGEDDRGSFRATSRAEEKESEMRAWLALLIGVSAAAAVFTGFHCDAPKRDGANSLVNTVRILTTGVVCLANGEDETEPADECA
jgi:hypothetical protein